MSMTTEHVTAGFAGSTPRLWVPRLRRAVLFLIAGLGWIVLLLGLTLWIEPTREVVIWSPGQARLLRVIEQAPVSLVEIPGRAMVVRGEEAGYVTRLYASGAWLVLPARRGVCGDRTARARPAAPAAQTRHDTGPVSIPPARQT